jgi:hypothetical protein
MLLLFVHHNDTPDNYLRNVLCSSEIVSLINTGYVFLPLSMNDDEGKNVFQLFGQDLELRFTILNPSTTEIIGKSKKLASKSEACQLLADFLPKVTKKPNPKFANDRYIREQQEREFMEAEKIAFKQNEEEKRNREMKRKEEEEAQYLREREEKERIEKLNIVGEEPKPGPNVSQITFRLQNGEKLERRFLQHTPIQTLYMYLEGKGIKEADIVAGFPATVLRDGTLESEGLIGRVLIHVRFKE